MEMTEEYAEQQILKDTEWFDEHSEELNMLRNAINKFLSADNINSLYNLCTFFADGVLIENYKGVPDIAYCIIGIDIMMKEFNMHYDNMLFLKGVNSIEEVIYKVNTYKFQILNIEFNINKQEKMKLLVDDLLHDRISSIALLYMVKYSAVDACHILNLIMEYMDLEGCFEKKNELSDMYKVLFGQFER